MENRFKADLLKELGESDRCYDLIRAVSVACKGLTEGCEGYAPYVRIMRVMRHTGYDSFQGNMVFDDDVDCVIGRSKARKRDEHTLTYREIERAREIEREREKKRRDTERGRERASVTET